MRGFSCGTPQIRFRPVADIRPTHGYPHCEGGNPSPPASVSPPTGRERARRRVCRACFLCRAVGRGPFPGTAVPATTPAPAPAAATVAMPPRSNPPRPGGRRSPSPSTTRARSKAAAMRPAPPAPPPATRRWRPASGRGKGSHGQFKKVTFERRFSPGAAQLDAGKLQPGDMLLGRQVMFLTIDAKGAIQSCKVVASSGDAPPDYGCDEAEEGTVQGRGTDATAPGVHDRPAYGMERLLEPHRAHATAAGGESRRPRPSADARDSL